MYYGDSHSVHTQNDEAVTMALCNLYVLARAYRCSTCMLMIATSKGEYTLMTESQHKIACPVSYRRRRLTLITHIQIQPTPRQRVPLF